MNEKLSLWDLYQNQKEITARLDSHSHDASNLTGFENIAITGKFEDLKELPPIVNTVNGKTGNVILNPNDIGAIPSNASCNKNWNFIQKNNQPANIWGCSDNIDMYLYNPLNIKVGNSINSDYAISSGNSSISNNSLKLEGYSLERLKSLILQEVESKMSDRIYIRPSLTQYKSYNDVHLNITNNFFNITNSGNEFILDDFYPGNYFGYGILEADVTSNIIITCNYPGQNAFMNINISGGLTVLRSEIKGENFEIPPKNNLFLNNINTSDFNSGGFGGYYNLGYNNGGITSTTDIISTINISQTRHAKILIPLDSSSNVIIKFVQQAIQGGGVYTNLITPYCTNATIDITNIRLYREKFNMPKDQLGF